MSKILIPFEEKQSEKYPELLPIRVSKELKEKKERLKSLKVKTSELYRNAIEEVTDKALAQILEDNKTA